MSQKQYFLRLDNPIKAYAWGHNEHIARLLGQKPGEAPQAEMWMGAHSGGPSRVAGSDLATLIAAQPQEMLGSYLYDQGITNLPFLFKVLAAAKPLSIQCHPSLAAARAGFADEEARAVPLSDDRRNYKDANHKPETICALTEFWGLCGFRAATEIRADFEHLSRLAKDIEAQEFLADLARHGHKDGIAEVAYCSWLVETILSPDKRMPACCRELARLAAQEPGDHFRFLTEAAGFFPGDPGLFFLVVLRLHRLEPGQSLSIPAGVLHAYLSGFGIELMANSDNVLRGGLTPKHVDIRELLANLDCSAGGIRFDPPKGQLLTRYPAFVSEFCLSRVDSANDAAQNLDWKSTGTPQIFLCTRGTVAIKGLGVEAVVLKQGESLYVLPGHPDLQLEVQGEMFVAAVPESRPDFGVVLGVDGGGTSTRACLMDQSGAIQGIGRSGPSSVDTVPLIITEASIRQALEIALRNVAGDMPIIGVCAGIGGIVSKTDESAVESILRHLPRVSAMAKFLVVNDMKTALAAGTVLKPGITCILGTGSVAFGRNAAGAEWKSGGWGFKEGDPGSSYDLGISAIRAMVRAYDGRIKPSAFTIAVFNHLEMKELGDITRKLYQEDMTRTQIAALAPLVTEWANKGDVHATAVIDRAVRETVETIGAVFRRLFATGAEMVPVAIVGSLGNAPGYYRDSLAKALLLESPRLIMQAAVLEPVVGAALWALQAYRPDFDPGPINPDVWKLN